jgi:hypothetical protein
MKEWKYIPSNFLYVYYFLYEHIFYKLCTSKIQIYEKKENKRMLTFILYKKHT